MRWFTYLLLLAVCLPLFTSCEKKKTIVNGLEEKEANEIIVFLSNKNIDASKVQEADGGGGGAKIVLWDISVDEAEAIEAMSLLNQAGLPRRPVQSLLGIFGNVGLVPSDVEQKIRYEAGLAAQIASTIRKIDGVLDAEVNISFPQEDPLNPGQFKGRITSSVYVKHSGVLDDPNSHLMTKIKRLVASSVTGLDYDNVTVIPDRARYSEYQAGLSGTVEEEKQYVSIWSVIVAKESVTRFRTIFFSFVVLCFLLILSLVWISWKIYPILSKSGGVKELFSLHPIKFDDKAGKSLEPPKGESQGKSAEEIAKEQEEKDVDIT